jgi:hypothetical protein
LRVNEARITRVTAQVSTHSGDWSDQSTPEFAVVDARIVAQVQFDDGRVEQWDSGGVYEAITVPADEHAMIAVLSAFVREKVNDDVLYDMKMANISVVGEPSGAPIAWDLSGL